MNVVDWGIILVLLVSSVISLKRGFIKEALSLTVWLMAFVVANGFSPTLAPHLEAYASTPSSQQTAAFAILFIVSLLLGSAVNYLVASLVKVTGVFSFDHALGVFFGFIRGALIITAVVLYVPLALPIDQDLLWQQSILIPYFLNLEEPFHQFRAAVFDLFVQFI